MRARTRNKASLPSSDFPRAEERPMSSATCLRACRRPKTGPEVGSGKATASSSPRRRRGGGKGTGREPPGGGGGKTPTARGGRERFLEKGGFFALPFSGKSPAK